MGQLQAVRVVGQGLKQEEEERIKHSMRSGTNRIKDRSLDLHMPLGAPGWRGGIMGGIPPGGGPAVGGPGIIRPGIG